MKSSGAFAASSLTPDLDLDLPDWSGMDRSARSLPAEAAWRLNDEYRITFGPFVKNGWRERRIPCPAEFVL